MKNIGPITVFTNVLRTAVELSEIADCTVILTGGRLRAKELTLSGFPSDENLDHFNIDKAFIGIGGITEAGITDFHTEEARLHRRLIDNAKQSIALADSGKIGLRAMNNVCTLREIDLVITDKDAPLQAVASLKEAGAKVILAK
jgi:DeoR/GlpR family transcriptional regulator of sugar metabolism